jgi:hypothetical protein
MNFEAQLAGGAANAGVMETAARKGRQSKKRTEIPPDQYAWTLRLRQLQSNRQR